MIPFGIGIACERIMKLLDDDLFLESADNIEASNGLVVEDKDILNNLENKAAEVEDETDSIE